MQHPARPLAFLMAALACLLLVGCTQPARADGDPPPPDDAIAATAVPFAPQPATTPPPAPATEGRHPLLLTANANADTVSFVDPNDGRVESVVAAASPWQIALTPQGYAYVSAAQGVAVVDVAAKATVGLIPYRTSIPAVRYGEFRPGGMGIAAAPDGSRVYVGVYGPNGESRLEVIDTAAAQVVAAYPVGVRPFGVLVSPNGGEVYSLDHDSYGITVLDVAAGTTRKLETTPLGRGAYDKPHYGSVLPNGHLLLPFQGRTLLDLDPATGRVSQRRLTADTHQHGIGLTADNQRAVIIGTGPAGNAYGPPSLTVVDVTGANERLLPLRRAHELVALSPDGRYAYLSGGNLLDGGWNGLTVVDLESGATRELPVPGAPVGVAVLP